MKTLTPPNSKARPSTWNNPSSRPTAQWCARLCSKRRPTTLFACDRSQGLSEHTAGKLVIISSYSDRVLFQSLEISKRLLASMPAAPDALNSLAGNFYSYSGGVCQPGEA